jgi:hypothetical protein
MPRWSSTNPGVIVIDPAGKATAVGEGNASIEVSGHGQRGHPQHSGDVARRVITKNRKLHKLARDGEVDAHTVDTAGRGRASSDAVGYDTVARVVLAFEREKVGGAAPKLRLVHLDV